MPNDSTKIPPYNCASDCFPRRNADKYYCGATKNCSNLADVSLFDTYLILPKSLNATPEGIVLFRTPSAASFGGPCACEVGTPIVATLVAQVLPGSNDAILPWHLKVTVRRPWHVGVPVESGGCAVATPAQCQDLGPNDHAVGNWSNLQIWTEDPEAPPVNVIVAPGDCP